MVEIENEAITSIIEIDDETKGIKQYFGNEVERQRSLVDQGYVFSAANEAFLNFIDVSTINVILKNEADLPRKKGDIGICLSGISRPQITDDNFEWIVGADLRQQWAHERLNDDHSNEELISDEKFVRFNDLMYGDAWCNVAKEILASAPDDGNTINESSWKEIAKARISEAKGIVKTDPNLESRLQIAEDSFEKGLYGAAIFDAVYVIENEEVTTELTAGEGIEAETMRLLNKEYSSLWANIYQSHGVFLHNTNESNGAYRTLRFADGLEEAVLEMENTIQPAEEVQEEDDLETILVLVTLISIFILLIAVIFVIRRVHGSKRNRKTHKTKQKKGRA
jgi:hypothetical protein